MTTVNLAPLDSEEARNYFRSGVDRRIVGGFRMALEWLGIEVPDYARRKEAGTRSRARLAGSVHSLTPLERHRMRYPPMSPEEMQRRVAAAIAKDQMKRAKRQASNH